MQKKIHKVAITGGTHGNELTGVYLVHKFKKNPTLVKRSSFETLCFHVNHKAIERCTRYIDRDMNRCFTCKELEDTTLSAYEEVLAKEFNTLLGPKGSKSPRVDFLMDLHTTTANMGLSLCISTKDSFTWQAAAYAKECLPELNIFFWDGSTIEPSFISSIPKSGFTIEVGPIPQGVLQRDIFEGTEKIVHALLDFFEAHNTQALGKTFNEIEVYEYITSIDYPRDEKGNVGAMIHPSLQDSGYFKIKKGDALFITLEGEHILYEGEEEVYTVFVNEAAYYEKGVAMQLCRKKSIAI